MMHRPTTLLLLCLALTATSCVFGRAAINEPIDAARLAELQPGVTTAREVVERLGAPTEVVQLGYRTAYRYDRSLTKRSDLFALIVVLRNSDTRQDRVWLFFDEEERLTHVGSTFQAADTRYAFPWSKLHDEQ